MYPYSQDLLNTALTYAEYRANIAHDLAKPDTLTEQQQAMLKYFAFNSEVMDYEEQHIELLPETKAYLDAASPANWLVITEGWCGDAGRSVPLLHKMAEYAGEKIQLRLVLRDQNLPLIDAHLTNGGRSIPKLIVLRQDLQELAVWGPRPANLQAYMNSWKEEVGKNLPETIKRVKAWYEEDKSLSTQKSLLEVLPLRA
ncbi:MAG: thioredoxin family protein [Bacteroidota bacterium]